MGQNYSTATRLELAPLAREGPVSEKFIRQSSEVNLDLWPSCPCGYLRP